MWHFPSQWDVLWGVVVTSPGTRVREALHSGLTFLQCSARGGSLNLRLARRGLMTVGD